MLSSLFEIFFIMCDITIMTETYSEADYRNDAPPRAFGSETEYTTDLPSKPLNTMMAYDSVKNLPFFLGPGRNSLQSIVLKNGGEAYRDCGDMLEYATPECSSPDELVLHERVGEHIVKTLVERLDETSSSPTPARLYKRTGYGDIYARDNTKLLTQMSTGHHESYSSLILQRYPFDFFTGEGSSFYPREFYALSSYLATRPIWAGAGMVDTQSYSISQKKNAIAFSEYGDPTTEGEKSPLIIHNDRVELRSGDGNMSDWAIKMKYALSSLVLRLIEHDEFPDHLLLKDTTDIANAVAGYPNVRFRTATGELTTAVEHQSRIIDAAYETLAPAGHIHTYEEKAIEQFDIFKKDYSSINFSENDVRAIADRVDWATKLHYMFQQGILHRKINGWNLKAVAADLSYERIDKPSYALRVQKKLGRTTLWSSEEIMQAVITPPKTRAARRVRLISALQQDNQYVRTEWEYVKSSEDGEIDLGGPL